MRTPAAGGVRAPISSRIRAAAASVTVIAAVGARRETPLALALELALAVASRRALRTSHMYDEPEYAANFVKE